MIESFIGVWFLIIIIYDVVTPEKEIPTIIDSEQEKEQPPIQDKDKS